MDSRPIGVFDSGLGGLTAVRELKRLLPNETVIYFGDTGRMPYGVRPAAEIRRIAVQNIEFIQSFNVKAVVAACGTISSTADDILSGTPVFTRGVLKPGTARLCQSRADAVGVIATATSIASGAYQKRIGEIAPDKKVIAAACPQFVPLIESGRFDRNDEKVRAAVRKYLEPMRDAGVGALLLGCTHYGLIAEAIDEFFDGRVELISASRAAAEETRDYLVAGELLGNGAEDRFFTSGSVSDFEKLGEIFLGRELRGRVEFIEPFEI